MTEQKDLEMIPEQSEHTEQTDPAPTQNKVAAAMRAVFWLVLILTAVSAVVNLYTAVTQFSAMDYPMGVILMSILPSIFTNICVFVPVAFLFLFFSELLILLSDKKERHD